MCLAHLPHGCARANSETLDESHPTPGLILQSRLRNLSRLVLPRHNQQRHFHSGGRKRFSAGKVHS